MVPIEDAVVMLTDSLGNQVTDINGDLVGPMMTDENGFYQFDDLFPGDYIVVFETPEGFVPTDENVNGEADDEGADDSDPNEDGESDNIWLDSGEDEPDVDAGFFAPASVGTSVNDVDGNAVAAVMTAADGTYEFTNLIPGDYKVTFELPATPTGLAFAAMDAAADDIDSDVDPATGMTEVFTLISGEELATVDAGAIDIEDPVIVCPDDIVDLGCNPVLPTPEDAIALVTASDNCAVADITAVPGPIEGDCEMTQSFEVTVTGTIR